MNDLTALGGRYTESKPTILARALTRLSKIALELNMTISLPDNDGSVNVFNSDGKVLRTFTEEDLLLCKSL